MPSWMVMHHWAYALTATIAVGIFALLVIIHTVCTWDAVNVFQ